MIALAPWLYPELDVSPLDGRRFAVLHGSLDRGLPGVPGVRPEPLAAAATSARRHEEWTRGAQVIRGAIHPIALRTPWGERCRCRVPAVGRTSVGGELAATVHVGLYRAARGAVYVLARVLYRIEIVGRVPPGPCVVAANHESLLDPPLLALVTRRPLHFLAKVELWRYPFGSLADGRARRDSDPARPARPALGRACRRAPRERASAWRSSRRAG